MGTRLVPALKAILTGLDVIFIAGRSGRSELQFAACMIAAAASVARRTASKRPKVQARFLQHDGQRCASESGGSLAEDRAAGMCGAGREPCECRMPERIQTEVTSP